jgi:hypothetical protein
MTRSSSPPSRKISTREVIILAASAAGIGLAILGLSLWLIPKEHEVWREAAKEVGTAIIGIGVISCIWDLFARRTLMREVLDSVNLAEQVDDAGLQVIAHDYTLDVPWGDLFDSTATLDLFVSYART